MQCAVGCVDEQMGVLLPSYEFNLLTIPEKEKFEAHLQACRPCADEVASMQHVHAMLRAHRDVFQHPERYRKERRSFRVAFRLQPASALAAAALLLVLLGVGYFHQPTWRAAGLIASEAEDGARFRKQSPDLADGIKAFQTQQLATAIGKLQAVSAKDDRYYVAQYFLGLCYLQPPDSGWLRARSIDPSLLNQAIGALQRSVAASDRDPLYQAKARLALAKAYRLAGEREKAMNELVSIERMPEPEEQIGKFRQEAAKLKAQLE